MCAGAYEQAGPELVAPASRTPYPKPKWPHPAKEWQGPSKKYPREKGESQPHEGNDLSIVCFKHRSQQNIAMPRQTNRQARGHEGTERERRCYLVPVQIKKIQTVVCVVREHRAKQYTIPPPSPKPFSCKINTLPSELPAQLQFVAFVPLRAEPPCPRPPFHNRLGKSSRSRGRSPFVPPPRSVCFMYFPWGSDQIRVCTRSRTRRVKGAGG